jgi:hypothetical protein
MTTAASVDDLYRLKRLSGLAQVTVRSGAFKRVGLLRHALKYGLWALAPGGRLDVVDDGPASYQIRPGAVPFSIVRQQAHKVLGADVTFLGADEAALTLSFQRVKPVTPPGWTAGVVFSGREAEMPALETALAGLRAQPELEQGAGGQIVVCGPEAARGLLAHHPDVEYLPFADPPGPRPMITLKKNLIVAAARNPRVAVMHARIVLQPGCLAAAPPEFDVLTPRVEYREGRRVVPYLDYIISQALDGEAVPSRQPPPNTFDRARYLAQLRHGRPYLDGGVFFAMRAAALATPLSPHLAWGEAEDLEWCARLHAAGALVDLEPDAVALSQTFKWPRLMVERPRLYAFGRHAARALRRAQAAIGR